MRFHNRIAIVTAGSSGIGLACAHRFASEGAKVLNADIRSPSAKAEAQFQNLAGEWSWFEADLGEKETPNRVVNQALSLWGRVDILVNNAAYVSDQSGATLDASLEQWERPFDISVKGTFQ
jgi:NAD(P)-dependent dehydrogenase (short-subunit alcohol dehydrogenase family)